MTIDPESQWNSETDESAGDHSGLKPANDNPDGRFEKELKKLYERLPKIISRISEDNKNEAEVALHGLFAHFRKINELERNLLKPGESYEPLNLSRIYRLAVSGNGNDQAVEELQAANAAFAEENTVLSELVESMTFQMDTLKRQSADEMLAMGKAKVVPLQNLKAALEQVSQTMGKIEEQLLVLSQPGEAQAQQKTLDERMTEGLTG